MKTIEIIEEELIKIKLRKEKTEFWIERNLKQIVKDQKKKEWRKNQKEK
jgi:hypothetical protein